jgi:uncharacterized membrane protein YtjA (UPF0391 family)
LSIWWSLVEVGVETTAAAEAQVVFVLVLVFLLPQELTTQ